MEDNKIEQIVEAIGKLDFDEEGNTTKAGKPDATVLTETLGFNVSAKERDEAYEVFLARVDEDSTPEEAEPEEAEPEEAEAPTHTYTEEVERTVTLKEEDFATAGRWMDGDTALADMYTYQPTGEKFFKPLDDEGERRVKERKLPLYPF